MKSVQITKQLLPLALGLLWVCALTSGCGQERRSTSSGRGGYVDRPADADANKAGNGRDTANKKLEDRKSLSWDLACQTLSHSDEQIVDDKVIGGGTFRTSGAKTYGITFNGSHCDGANPQKDVILLLDLSTAMAEQDPFIDGSCKRLEMTSTIIKSFAGTVGTRFALIGFSNGSVNSVVSSGRFFESEQALMGGLEFALEGQTVAEALCESTNVGVDYNAGLTAAESMIKVSGADGAATVVLFVTADRPVLGQTGQMTSTRLRANGTLITTLMVGAADDQVLLDRVASVDKNGIPMHVKVSSGSELIGAVSDLTTRIEIPDVLRYRAVGTGAWNVINLFPLPNSLNWSVPPLDFPASAWPNGVELEHIHYLSDGTGKGITKGTLTFQP